MTSHFRPFLGPIPVALAASVSLAGTRPSLSIERCTMNASDIILVKDDGKQRPSVTVIESWKGDLKPGDIIRLTGLPTASDPKPTVQWNDTAFPDPLEGRTIVYFLAHTPSKDGPRTAGEWNGAASPLWASAAFIDGDHVFGFHQTINPGPSTLNELPTNPAQLRADVQQILKAKDELRIASAIASDAERAQALLPIARAGYTFAQREALQLLGKCGAPAVPLLRNLTITTSKHAEGDWYWDPAFEYDVSNALSAAAGPDRAKELTPIVLQEFTYWSTAGPGLPAGWGNTSPRDDVPRNHHARLLAALTNLKGSYKPSGNDPVRQVRDLWNSVPRLHDSEYAKSILDACDELLR